MVQSSSDSAIRPAPARQPRMAQALPARPATAQVANQQRSMTAKAATANGADGDDEEEDDLYEPSGASWFERQASWMTSTVVHAIGLMVLALWPTQGPDKDKKVIVAAPPAVEEEPEVEEEPPKIEFDDSKIEDAPVSEMLLEEPEAPMSESLVQDNMEEGANSASQMTQEEFSTDKALKSDLISEGFGGGDKEGTGTGKGDKGFGAGLGGRGERRSGALGRGASRESEKAVDNALKWLAAHQLPDGSWSFDHRDGVCNGRCKNQGSFKDAKGGATGIALLAFLGAGKTHLEGEYKQTVDKGLKFLMAVQKAEGIGGASWHEKVGNSTNYSHGLATLAMCEAYGMALDFKPVAPKPGKSQSEMTEEERKKFREEQEKAKKDKDFLKNAIPVANLQKSAQAALDFIVAEQHPEGGWRYQPKQAGDTSVVGWMLMALKSGYMSKLRVNKGTVIGASKFLDSVQDGDYGHIYHYLPEKNRPADATHATTAIGLLCRMYLGWDKNHPGIAEGVNLMGNTWGPEINGGTNMYYNYYATQVVFHYGGDTWKEWNKKMRDHLVASQEKNENDHAFGSWYFNGDHGSPSGGRLYLTALSAMTLEVYYRYMPIYKNKSVEEDLQKGLEGDGKKDDKKKDEKKEEKKEEKKAEKKDEKKEDKKADAKK
jgi:hypothetical protein